MTARLLLDEHYSDEIAAQLRASGHDVAAVVSAAELRALPDADLFRHAAATGQRIVTENIKDFRPLQQSAYAGETLVAALLLVPPGRFPRGSGRRTAAIVAALARWLTEPDVAERPDEDWLI